MAPASRFGVAYVARALRTSQPLASSAQALRFSKPATMNSFRASSIILNNTRSRSFHSTPMRRNEAVTPAAPSSVVETVAATAPSSVADTVAAAAQTQLDPTPAVQAAMQIGDLAKYGLDTTLPTRLTEYALEFVHVTTGLPWWATIAAVVVAIRAACFPLAVFGQRNVAKLNNHKPELTLIMEEQKRAQAAGDFYKRRGIYPFRGALAGAASAPFMMLALQTGGLWWFTDLSVMDPTYILPVLSCVGMMGVIELQSRLNSATEQSKQAKILMRCMGVGMAYFTSGLPAGIFTFWVVNNLVSVGQVGIMHTDWFRKKYGVVDITKVKFAREQESIDSQKKSTKFVVKHKDISAPTKQQQ
ncbi:hypothetical protein DL89DRAFT_264827 [Linderina pennispora]|uniref:Membrane insertase YidC/Oxa/ALB C-terminal domain-containing protein n=1 Tax=Linderina pennispora TaxID=61395 RepID=A0A1Y1WGD0_9FUNG|nr:uncharacterized protein DL89DRAFT_264827 [Linderina pennispora]ORX72601.1 hypothetical protein DL89DRAFT_264827 [Linderina pennispora]